VQYQLLLESRDDLEGNCDGGIFYHNAGTGYNF